MVGPPRDTGRRPTQSRLISTGSTERTTVLIGLFVGGLIGPALLVIDHDRLYRGIFVIAISALMLVMTVPAWLAGRGQSTP